VWVGTQLSNIFSWIAQTVSNFFSSIYDAVKGWFSGVIQGINTWTSDMFHHFLNKIDDILFANMIIMGSKHIITNLTTKAGDAHKLEDIGYHILGNLAGAVTLPITALVVKEVIASTIKQMGGTEVKLFPEETDVFKYMPSMAITPPSMPKEPSENYKPSPSVYDTGYSPSISHTTPEAGEVRETPEFGTPPSAPPAPSVEEPPSTTPPPSEPQTPPPPPPPPPVYPTSEFTKMATVVSEAVMSDERPMKATVVEEVVMSDERPMSASVVEEVQMSDARPMSASVVEEAVISDARPMSATVVEEET